MFYIFNYIFRSFIFNCFGPYKLVFSQVLSAVLIMYFIHLYCLLFPSFLGSVYRPRFMSLVSKYINCGIFIIVRLQCSTSFTTSLTNIFLFGLAVSFSKKLFQPFHFVPISLHDSRVCFHFTAIRFVPPYSQAPRFPFYP